MVLHLVPSTPAELLPEMLIEFLPRWMLDERVVLLGPYSSAEEHDRYISQTTGSADVFWSGSEEFRFDKQTLQLQSVQLRVPDNNLPPPFSLASWQAASQESGLLQLLDAQFFHVEPTDFRWMDLQGQALICLDSRAGEDAQERLRLRIASNLELFFADGLYCGWSLHHPIRFLVSAWEQPEPEEDAEHIVPLLYDYLGLVTYPYIDSMEDKDPLIRKALLDLYVRLMLQPPSRHRAIISDALADKLERFYDYNVNEQ